MASVAAGVLGSVPSALAETKNVTLSGVSGPSSKSDPRIRQAFNLRHTAALADSKVPAAPHTTNGEEQLYSDHSGSYSKPLLQDDICLVNQAAWTSFKKALNSGKMSDFGAIILGGTRTLNGPQASYAFDLEALDSTQFGNAPAIGDPSGPAIVPPFDTVVSSAYGTQLIEMYWASLLRDVAFTDYASNATAAAAAAELGAQPDYRGPRDSSGNVTPDLLVPRRFPG